MEDTLEKIIEFGDKAHGEQRRKYCDDRYMVHPVRVMRTCQKYTDDISVLAAALLHDVLEDTPVTEDEIGDFLKALLDEKAAEKALQYIIDLTDVYTRQVFPQMNRRARKAKETERLSKIPAESQTVKYADILDNADEIVDHDPDFARVFLSECRVILQHMKSGDAELKAIAEKTVEDALKKVKRNR